MPAFELYDVSTFIQLETFPNVEEALARFNRYVQEQGVLFSKYIRLRPLNITWSGN